MLTIAVTKCFVAYTLSIDLIITDVMESLQMAKYTQPSEFEG